VYIGVAVASWVRVTPERWVRPVECGYEGPRQSVTRWLLRRATLPCQWKWMGNL